MNDREDGAETTVTKMSLRPGGWIGYNNDAVFVQRDGKQNIKIRRGDIARVSLNTIEWDLAITSLLLIGVGLFVGATRNVLVGLGFVAVGCWSFYRTYSKRYGLVIRVQDEPAPVAVHPVAPKECYETLGDLVRSVGAGSSETPQ